MTNINPQSHIEVISADKLIVDERVQRAVDPVRVKREGARFNPNGVGVLIVSRRDDGTNHLIDGGHRHGFANAAGQPEFPFECKVWEGLSMIDEAALFSVHNNTRVVPPTAKHRVAVIGGDPRAVTVDTVLHNQAWRVDYAKGPGVLMAINTLYQVYDLAEERLGEGNGGLVIGRLMRLITSSWGHDPNGVTANLVGGIGRVLIRHWDTIEDQRLINALASEPNHGVGLNGRARGLQTFTPGTLSDCVATLVVRLHNGARRPNNKAFLPEWQRL